MKPQRRNSTKKYFSFSGLEIVRYTFVIVFSGSESMLAKNRKPSWCSRVCRELRKLILVSEHHPLVFGHFWSYPSIVAERRRHLLENKNIIHPFSKFSLAWRSFMILITLGHVGFSSVQLCIFVDTHDLIIMDYADYTIATLQVICFIDMIVSFNTGYLDKESASIVLNRRRITWAYLRSYWLADLLSSMPLAFLMIVSDHRSRNDYLIPDMLPLLRVVRVITALEDIKTLLQTLTNSHIWYRVISHIILFILAVHCFTCLLYVPSAVVFYMNGEVPPGYTGFLDTYNQPRVITDIPSGFERYVKAMFVAMSAFFSTGFTMFLTFHPGEIAVNSAILLFGTMFKMYTIVFALKTYTTVYSSTVRNQELMDQVEKYMHQKQFSASLMRRLREYYSYQFQESYYREKVALGCLSAQLQKEILLHTYQNFVEKTPVLQNLPSNFLGKFLGCLEPEVYMPNDLIFHVGDEGNYMYFIYTGTVALYSLKGVEVDHYDDGDIIGALELFTPETRRLTTLVVIEITQIYRLSAEDFRTHVMTNPELYSRIQREAEKRANSISMVDELVLVKRGDRGSSLLPDQPSK